MLPTIKVHTMLFEQPKFKDWLESSTFANCKLERQEFGEFLADYLTGEKDGFVLNLNGAWGSGKTEFLKRLYSLLLERDYPCIYIDAWESDFSKEPLTVVSSELLTQMQLLHSDVISLEETQKAKKVLGTMFKGLAVGVGAVVAKKLFDDSSTGVEFIKQLIDNETEPEEYVDKLSENYTQQVESIKHIRDSLCELAESMKNKLNVNLPVVVLVDELDRCRPNYAIEMLEVIKHFFNTPNIVFVVASDTQQLCESIKNVYGSNFDSYSYLKRFFDRRTILPKPHLLEYVQLKITTSFEEEIKNNGLFLYPNFRNSNHIVDTVVKYIARISEAFDLGIRDTDQLLARFRACLRYAINQHSNTNKVQVINVPILIMALIEFDLGLDSYDKRSTRKHGVYPTYQNSDVLIDTNLNVETLIQISMLGVLLHELRFPEKQRKSEFNHLRYKEIERYHNQGSPHILAIVADSVLNAIEQHTSSPLEDKSKVWLWVHYKKVIELAGNIER